MLAFTAVELGGMLPPDEPAGTATTSKAPPANALGNGTDADTVFELVIEGCTASLIDNDDVIDTDTEAVAESEAVGVLLTEGVLDGDTDTERLDVTDLETLLELELDTVAVDVLDDDAETLSVLESVTEYELDGEAVHVFESDPVRVTDIEAEAVLDVLPNADNDAVALLVPDEEGEIPLEYVGVMDTVTVLEAVRDTVIVPVIEGDTEAVRVAVPLELIVDETLLVIESVLVSVKVVVADRVAECVGVNDTEGE